MAMPVASDTPEDDLRTTEPTVMHVANTAPEDTRDNPKELAEKKVGLAVLALQQAFGDIAHHNDVRFETGLQFLDNVCVIILAEMTHACFETPLDLFAQEFFSVEEPWSDVVSHVIYAVLVTFVSAWLSSFLRTRTEGATRYRDFLKLLSKVAPVLTAWAWKNAAYSLEVAAPRSFFTELMIALSLTALITVWQLLPCYSRAKADIREGGHRDTPLARLICSPASMALTLGFVWDILTIHFINLLCKDMTPHEAFCIRFVWSGCLLCAIDKLHHKLNHFYTDSGIPQWKVTLVDVTCSTCTFINGWAILRCLDAFVFEVVESCGAPLKCSYQANLFYSLFITALFAQITGIMNTVLVDNHTEVSMTLQKSAMQLTAGWAWMNFFSVWIAFVQRGESTLHQICSSNIAHIFLWVLLSAFHHWANTISRAEKRSTTSMLERSHIGEGIAVV